MSIELQVLQMEVEDKLQELEKAFGPSYKLTLIASHNGSNGLKDADLLFTRADRQSILKVVNRLLPERSTD